MEQAAEAAAAAAGGMFSAGALFPLEVIKTNLQAHTKQKNSTPSSPPPPPPPPPVEEEAAGGGGGDSVTTSVPGEDDGGGGGGGGRDVEGQEEGRQLQDQHHRQHRQSRLVWLARQNDSQEQRRRRDALESGRGLSPSSPSVVSVAKDIYAREGLAGLYRGVWYASCQSGVEKAAYFYGYGWLKTLALRGGGAGGELSTVTDLGLGYLAEAFHLPLTIPIEVVLTKIMTSKDKTNAFAVIQGILSESGPAGFYTGIQAYVVLCLKPAIQYAVFNRLKAITLSYRRSNHGGSEQAEELTAVQAFVIGAISRAVATVIVFPYIRAKVIIMSRKAGSGNDGGGSATSTSILASLLTIVKDDGVSALFQGIAPEIGRGVLSAALMLMVKEKIHSAVKDAIVGGAPRRSIAS